ncbi:DUF1223 domain-containing protein [Lichenifustis flavocetrariae]|uniref:DUF1223 domain-containing protein n=1 Tax=Lichenifustis flavocetrariae TaxID=2949735 RepID=A0AA41YYG9_9HYPH|nr:DUF1223 domain-containing protein [Lichenifustis flavocetrariae]MCW6510434.1 DUF1223 domain-containing protein [Lichenifustis flavocetrariae]
MISRIFAACTVLASLSAAAVAAERPVVVELFTSEGCSSCPPADAYLSELSRERRDVLPLAFHVTYWNSLGWTDPFSLAAATQRQSRYGARFGDGSYTPELVVDGRKGLVGSERGEAEAAIATARHAGLTAASVTATRQGSAVSINVGGGRGSGRVILVGYDAQHHTAVGRGENGGRTLTESNIVRSIRAIGQWTGAPLTLDAAAPAGEKAAVLIEAPDGSIIGAARADAS